MGCDGVFDQLSDKEIIESVWHTIKDPNIRKKSYHLQCGIAVELIIKASLARKSLDNITCILLGFNNFEKVFNNPLILLNQLNTIKQNQNTKNEAESGEKTNNTPTNHTIKYIGNSNFPPNLLQNPTPNQHKTYINNNNSVTSSSKSINNKTNFPKLNLNSIENK